ncbi:MAG TPA: MerR family transcriptional regulator [Nitrospiria bacterium]
MSEENGDQLGSAEVCKRVGISSRQLEYWVLIGIVAPRQEPHGQKVFKRFSIHDIEILKEVKSLTDMGFLVSRALEKVRKDHPELFTDAKA